MEGTMTVATSPQDSERPRRRLGTIDDVLAVLPLAKNSVYDAARYGRMPGVVRVGRRVLFDLDVVDAWIDAGGGRPE
jgi:predicted DNA-binding transcriptional regulator AlpA